MAASRRTLLGTAGLAVVVAGLSFTILAGAVMAKTFHLSISGVDGARYSGACTIMAAAGDEHVGLEGAVPLEREFDADALTCRFQTEGQVVVEIAHDGSRSRSATMGRTIQVSAR